MRFGGLLLVALVAMELPIDGAHGCDCGEIPDSSYVVVTYDHPMSTTPTVTITPDGSGESFADKGITVSVVIRSASSGIPCGGLPGQEIVLWNSGLCVCPGGNTADGPTDVNGRTTFTRILGGGCAEYLTVFHTGVPVGTIPIRINSADANANCFTDAGDVSRLARALGSGVGNPNYTFCLDFDEDGHIAAADVSYLASRLGRGGCP